MGNGNNVSAYLRRGGEKLLQIKSDVYKRNRVREEGGGGGDSGATAEISLQPVVRLLCACSPWRAQGSRDPPAAPGGTHTGAGGCTQKRLCPRGKPMLVQAPGRDLQNREEKSPHWSRSAGRNYDPVGD